MKALMKFFLFFSMMLLIGLYSCEKDDENGDNGDNGDTTLPATEAKAEVSNAINSIKGDMDEMMETEAMGAMMFMMSLDPDFAKSLPFNSSIVNPIKVLSYSSNPTKNKLFENTYTAKEEDDDIWGVYHYNFETGYFDKVGPHEFIVIHFPADQDAYDDLVNNGIFAITDLVLQEFNVWDDWDEEYYIIEMPTRIEANMTVNDVTVFNFDFTASWQLSNDNEYVNPSSLNATMSITPFSMSVNFSGSNRDYTAKANVKKNNNILLDTDIAIKLTASLWDDEPEKISGYFQFTPIKAIGYANIYAVGEASDIDPPDVNQMNQNIDIDIWHTELNRKLGHLEVKAFVTDHGEDIEPVIVYSDGSFQKLDDIFKPIIDEIEDLFGDFK